MQYIVVKLLFIVAAWDSGRLNGEFYGSKQYSTEKRNKHDAYVKGVYRLKVGNTLNSATEMTDCIPYNATVDEMTQSINKLLQISKRRGVTVRRYGDQYDPRYSFGYTYRIEVDAASTSYADQGALTLTLGCYGLSCGCADTKVIKYGPTGAPLCPNPSNYSLVTDNSCIIPPTISTARITKLSYLKTSGSGILQISDGAHRLPPLATVKISITSGKGVVTADTVAWTALEAKGVGKIIIGGAGWPGWDSSHLLFDPEWTDRRGLVKSLRNAPPCNLTSNQFLVDGFGSVLTAGPGSYLIWNTGTWSGGIIGGLSKLSIEQRIDMKGSQKALKYGMSMFVRPAATADWSQGNISLSNGAHVIIEGKLIVSNIAGKYPVAVGESHLLESSDSNGRALELLQAEQGRNWQSYFDNKIVTELRSGWYENPLCEGKCLLINELVIQGNGEIRAGDGSATIYLLPLNIVGSTRFNIRAGAIVNLASGGIFGNDVIVDLSVGTTLELSGGQMLMEATCTIQGAGELLVSAGSHNLAFSVDSHITIAGGTLVWPESRGTQKTITFNGGLLIKGTGQLEVQPFSTTIVVHEEVYLKDRSIIQFPLIGIAAQASPFDRSDAPDTSPRGTLTSTGTMRWEGGSLKGKADFNAEKELFLDGDSKYIKSLAKLVNKGHCEWGSGNIVTSDNGDFQNFGTIQMKEGVSKFSSNALYKGSELPVDNGGDFFALEYHSWDTDNGALDYREYLQLRTRFVSRVPDGWTSQDQ